MSEITLKTIELMEMLPEEDQKFAFEIIKKLVLAWDPDYTKLTENESDSLEKAKSEVSIKSNDINWDDLDKLDLN